ARHPEDRGIVPGEAFARLRRDGALRRSCRHSRSASSRCSLSGFFLVSLSGFLLVWLSSSPRLYLSMSKSTMVAPSILPSRVTYGRIRREYQHPFLSWISLSWGTRPSITLVINGARSESRKLGLISLIGRPTSVGIRLNS